MTPAQLAEVEDLAESLRAVAPDAPRLGLRERKKLAAMRRIQEIGLEQFDEHGFDAVTIEHIAEHAEVSPSSVYRYFGTKEGIVLHDEYDEQILGILRSLLARHDVHTAFEIGLCALARSSHAMSDERTAKRVALWLEVPSVRAAGFLLLDETARRIAEAMHEARPHMSLEQCRVVASSLVFPIFPVLEDWYHRGGVGDMVEPVLEAVRRLRPAQPFGS